MSVHPIAALMCVFSFLMIFRRFNQLWKLVGGTLTWQKVMEIKPNSGNCSEALAGEHQIRAQVSPRVQKVVCHAPMSSSHQKYGQRT